MNKYLIIYKDLLNPLYYKTWVQEAPTIIMAASSFTARHAGQNLEIIQITLIS